MKDLIKKNKYLFNIFIKYFWKPSDNSLTGRLYNLTRENNLTTCIQIGANDGLVNDPIYRLIRKNNWRVAFVEPQTSVFQKLLNETHKADPKHFYFNCAISDKNGLRPFYKIGFSDSRWAHGLSSFLRESLEDAFSSGYVERCAFENREQIPENPEELISTSMVECKTIDSILDHVSNEFENKINLLLIDTEGYDYEVLRLYPFRRTLPEIIVYEHHHLSTSDYQKSLELLKRWNYNVSQIGNDTIAINIGEK